MKCSLLALSSYLDDELDAGRRAEIEAHLVGCERCRKGLECLREETERFGALGRVHVPDDAVSGFLQQLGLLGPGENLPPRAPRPPDPPGPELPRWQGGGGAAETLPWSARHDPPPPPPPAPESDQPSLPFLDAFSASGLTVMALPAGELSGSEEFHLNGRSIPASTPPAAPEPVPGWSESRVPDGWPGGSVALPGVSTWWARRTVPLMAAGVEAAAPASAGIEAVAPPSARIEAAARSLAGAEHAAGNPAGVDAAAEVEPAASPAAVSPSEGVDAATPSYAGIDGGGSGSAEIEGAASSPAAIDAVSSLPGGIDAATPAHAGIEAVAPASTDFEAAAPAWEPEPAVAADDFPPPPPPDLVPTSPVSLAPPDRPASPLDQPPSPPPSPATAPLPDVPMWPQVPAPYPGEQMWQVAPPPSPHPRASDDDGDPWSWAPRDAPRPLRSSIYPTSVDFADLDPSAPDPAGAAAGGGLAADVAATGQVAYEDGTPDPLVGPLITRVGQPPQPLRATLISRLRDQVSLRLALMHHGDTDDPRPETAGAVPDHLAQPPESVGPLSAALRARIDPYTGAATPATPPVGGAVSARAVTGAERPPTGPWAAAPPAPGTVAARAVTRTERAPAGPWSVGTSVHSATIAEEIPGSSDRPRVRDLDRGPSKPGRHARQLGDRRWIGPDAGRMATSSGRFGDLTHRVRHLAADTRRRYAALAIVAILVVLVVTASLVLAHVGGPTTLPLAGTGTTSHPAPTASATPTPQLQPATVLQPSASVVPSAAPTPVPTPVRTPVPTPVVATQTYGGAGTGWQLQDVRCCDVQAGSGYTRIVFDLGGASGADPSATVSFPTATTMVVTFTGASASTSIEGDSGGGIVTGVNRESGSHVTFQLSLSRAATVKGWDYFGGTDAESSAPLHLYFDLG